jgi:hypothetical protein|tara:strand:+ start:180 stop:365 length:186 start_codon:yes stop_codon:yes gene_type:complete
MSVEEKKELEKLEGQLSYGRGIFQSAWSRLKELRAKSLESQGLDPSEWQLGGRYCERKALV